MVRIFIDLEMNMVDQKNAELRAKLPHEIIEIGAVKLDDSCRVVDRFRCYVRPRYNAVVHWSVAKLTGITTKSLKKEECLENVLPKFVEWVGTGESVRMYAWSDSDRAQIERECSYKKLWTPQLRAICAHWTDFQRVFSRMIGYRNGIALSRAVDYMGLSFDGIKHDALSDAENCARLMALMKDEAEFARRKALVPPEKLPPKRTHSTEKKADAEGEKKNPADRKKPAGEKKAAPPRKKRRRRVIKKKTTAPENGSVQTAAPAKAAAQSSNS